MPPGGPTERVGVLAQQAAGVLGDRSDARVGRVGGREAVGARHDGLGAGQPAARQRQTNEPRGRGRLLEEHQPIAVRPLDDVVQQGDDSLLATLGLRQAGVGPAQEPVVPPGPARSRAIPVERCPSGRLRELASEQADRGEHPGGRGGEDAGSEPIGELQRPFRLGDGRSERPGREVDPGGQDGQARRPELP